jgi:hypothetical protein
MPYTATVIVLMNTCCAMILQLACVISCCAFQRLSQHASFQHSGHGCKILRDHELSVGCPGHTTGASDTGLKSLAAAGFPVTGLEFDDTLAVRGLVVDVRQGSLVKVDRFGLVKRAMHGDRMLTPSDIRQIYGRDLVSLADSSRWVFLNTLFSVSEGCMYMQVCHARLVC